jgi:ethanolamine utilization cobalamin adenosyltransferase
MTYLQEIQTIEAAGIPTVEYRTQPQVDEQQLITIEFTPNATNDEYLIEQPEFVFGDIIVMKQQWENCFLNKLDTENLDTYTICGMELVEPKNQSGQMIDYPYWKYGMGAKRKSEIGEKLGCHIGRGLYFP